LYAVGLTQDLKRTSDIEQEQARRDYDEDRDPANFIRTRSAPRGGQFLHHYNRIQRLFSLTTSDTSGALDRQRRS
jgi:hypothetical protein